MTQEEKIEQLEKRLKVLEEKSQPVKKKEKRKPSSYNLFIGDAVKKIKKENPDIVYKEAFKLAVEMWNEQKTT